LKFGYQQSIADACKQGLENVNTFWIDALHKELDAIMIAFDVQPKMSSTYLITSGQGVISPIL